jgi:hypothetical protein
LKASKNAAQFRSKFPFHRTETIKLADLHHAVHRQHSPPPLLVIALSFLVVLWVLLWLSLLVVQITTYSSVLVCMVNELLSFPDD